MNRASSPAAHVRILNPCDVEPETVTAWSQLESRSLESNVYLSPHFVLPAIKHIDSKAPIIVMLIEIESDNKKSLIGVGVFIRRTATKKLPLPHLEAYLSPHSFSSGLLVDQECSGLVFSAFLNFMKNNSKKYQGVVFNYCFSEGAVSGLIEYARNTYGLKWFEFDSMDRAVLYPEESGENYINQRIPSRKKDICRGLRKLEKIGSVDWRVRDGNSADLKEAINCFLELEDMGWKGEAGSSLLSHSGHVNFFREMASELLAKKQAFFAELTLDGKVISSSFNLISGNAGFAFKIGCNPCFSKGAPGLINELELIRNASDIFEMQDYVDSGTVAGSYLEKLWLERHRHVYGALATTVPARNLLTIADHFRNRKQQLIRASKFLKKALGKT